MNVEIKAVTSTLIEKNTTNINHITWVAGNKMLSISINKPNYTPGV